MWRRGTGITGFVLVCALLVGMAARAQQPKPPEMSPSEAAEKRFPQPVKVGALRGRTVLEPLESQPVLGHVDRVVRAPGGAIWVVINYGGVFGLRSRPIAVPVEAMALLGDYLEVLDFSPAQLAKFPTFDDSGATALAADQIIRIGLARPSH